MDLYRLSGTTTQEFSPLNLDHVFANCLSLIEWPIRLPESLVPNDRLDIDIRIFASSNDEGDSDSSADNLPRIVSIHPLSSPEWTNRLHLIREEGFVDDLLYEEEQLGVE